MISISSVKINLSRYVIQLDFWPWPPCWKMVPVRLRWVSVHLVTGFSAQFTDAVALHFNELHSTLQHSGRTTRWSLLRATVTGWYSITVSLATLVSGALRMKRAIFQHLRWKYKLIYTRRRRAETSLMRFRFTVQAFSTNGRLNSRSPAAITSVVDCSRDIKKAYDCNGGDEFA